MRGHISTRRLQDGSVRYDVVFDAPRGPDGRRRQITRTFRSKREAERALAEHVRAVNTGQFHETNLTVNEYLDQWLASKVNLRPSTVRAYRIHLRLYIRPHLGRLRLLELRPLHIDAMYASIRASNSERERTVGASSIRRIHATLKSALTAAVKRRLIPYSPADHIELESPTKPHIYVWEADVVGRFLRSIDDDPLMPLFQLIAYRGLRRGEALGLRWGDVDLDSGQLTVARQIVQLGHETQVGPPKTKRGARTIGLDTVTVGVLRRHRTRQAEERLRVGEHLTDDDWVFQRPDGGHLDPGYVTKRFASLCRAAEVPVIRLHDLRHTSASLGLAAGESLKEVSERLGHSSITITADVYTHVTPTLARASAEKIASLVAESAR